ncbi:hypothetical protein TNCV_2269491 [Trichonephila clavipes]|nr:hypothetical protein TNCV_2269491 [Trichonephila clavipes]
MSSPRFEPRPYGTASSVAYHYTEWATLAFFELYVHEKSDSFTHSSRDLWSYKTYRLGTLQACSFFVDKRFTKNGFCGNQLPKNLATAL